MTAFRPGAARFLLVLVAAAALVPSLLAQRRQSRPKPRDFAAAVEAARQAFAQERYGAAIQALQDALAECQARQRVQILAAMPDLQGFTKKKQPEEDPADAAVAQALGGVLGGLAGMRPVEQEYTKEGQHLVIKVLPASPLVGMMKMVLNNPAMAAAQKGQEIIEYDNCKALLDASNDKRVKLTILVGDQSTVEVESRNMTADEVLQAMSQKNLDALTAPLRGK